MKKLVLLVIIILVTCGFIGCETDMNTSQETIPLTISYKHNFIMKSKEKSYTLSCKEYSYTSTDEEYVNVKISLPENVGRAE